MKELLKFMQNEDRNGSWLEWLEEIENGESEFDKDYVIKVLQNWYNESKEEKYLIRIKELQS